jgi:hypothetical protein
MQLLAAQDPLSAKVIAALLVIALRRFKAVVAAVAVKPVTQTA